MARMKMLVAMALAAVVGVGSLPVMAATTKAKPATATTATTNVKKTSTVNKKKTGKAGKNSKTHKTAKPHTVAAGKKKPITAKTATHKTA